MSQGPRLIGAVSSRAFRCLWMLEELGIPYEHVPAGPHGEVVLKYNPLGKIPVLVEEDGFSMYESAAINTYLGDKYRQTNPTLVPLTGTRDRGLYEQTVSVLISELDAQGLWVHMKHEVKGEIFTFIPDAVTHARKHFNKTNRTLIQQLKEGGPYLIGQEFTAADILYVHSLSWSKGIGWNETWKEEPKVAEYLDLCQSRPAYLRVKSMREKKSSL